MSNSSASFTALTDGAAATPVYSFSSDTNSGMYLASADNLSLTTGGVARLNITNSTITSTEPILVPIGTVGAPGLAFSGDSNTGIFSIAADVIGIVANGTESLRITDSVVRTFSTLRMGVDGAAATPAITWQVDQDTGFYRSAADEISIALNGAQSIRFATNGMYGGRRYPQGGTNLLPSFSFDGDVNTGIYRVAEDNLGISLGGTLSWDISTSAITSTVRGLYPSGTAALPSYSFSLDPNSGVYSAGADQVAISTAGTQRLLIESNGTLSVAGTANYETLVTDDDDIPNKKYVDDNSSGSFPLLAPNGTAGAPSYSFSGDTNTGIYSVGADNLGISTGGALRFDVSTTDVTSTVPIYNANGTAAAPSMTFASTTDLGFYRLAADAVGITSLGVLRAYINTNALTMQGIKILNTAGTAALPSYSFELDPNTGIYSNTADTLGFSAGGAAATLTSNGFDLVNGTAALPAYSFTSDPNSGLYRVGADNIGISTNGTLRFNVSTASVTSTLPFLAPNGTAGAPSIAFSTTTDLGLYRLAADAVGFSSGGTLSFYYNATSVTSQIPFYGENGTAGAPSYAFELDTDTGMYRSAADTLGFSAGGTLRATIDDTELVLANQILRSSNASGLELQSSAGNPTNIKSSIGGGFSFTSGNINIETNDITSGPGTNTCGSISIKAPFPTGGAVRIGGGITIDAGAAMIFNSGRGTGYTFNNTNGTQASGGNFNVTLGSSAGGFDAGTGGGFSVTCGIGQGSTSNVGGDITLTAGATNSSTGAQSGSVTIASGNGTRPGGDINLVVGDGNIAGKLFIKRNTLQRAVLDAETGNFKLGTGTNDASAMFEMESTTAGFLPPRMTNAQRIAISSPATGLMVYDTNDGSLEIYNGSQWMHGRRAASAVTTDATVTTIRSIATDADEAYAVHAKVIAIQSDGSESGYFDVTAVFYRDGGTVTQIGAEIRTERLTAGASAWDASIVLSGTLPQVQVTGAAATTITWKATIDVTTTDD